MVYISKIKQVGYGLGFGGTNAKLTKITSKHKLAINFLIKKQLCNFIDTSPEYANGNSEKLIGKLSSSEKKNIFISTKVSPENLNYDNFINSVKQSLKRLKIKKIDLIQPHWPNYDVDNDEIIAAFKFLKKKGKVRFFGLSNFDLIDIKYFKSRLRTDFKFIQEEYSLNDRTIEDTKIKYCEKNNLKIICYSPLGSGNLILNTEQKNLLSKISFEKNIPFYSVALGYLINKSKNLILIPHSTNLNNIYTNSKLSHFKMLKKDSLEIDKKFNTKMLKVKLKNIIFFDKNYKKIRNLQDAKENKYNLSPSPIQLSKKILQGSKLKPIKVRKKQKKLYLSEGRLRFWAYVIAYGWNYSIKVILK